MISKQDIKNAFIFGFNLNSEYQRRISVRNRAWEVDYFQDLTDAFKALSNNFRIKIVHGSAHQVSFVGCGSPWARSNSKCEIADLMIVVFKKSPNPSIRLSFIQVKLERGHANLGTINNAFNFKANLEQWDLLANRPQIKGVYQSFQPAPDTLAGAILPSVGCFLFLAPNNTNFMPNMVLSRADLLTVYGTTKNKNGMLSSSRHGIRQYLGYGEIGRVDGGFCFGASMFLHLVGTPIEDSRNVQDRNYRLAMRDLVCNLLEGESDELIRELKEACNISRTDAVQENKLFQNASRPTMIVIKTDGMPGKEA